LNKKSKELVYTSNYREIIYQLPSDTFKNMSNIEWVEKYLHPDDKMINQTYDKDASWPRKRVYRIIRPSGETRWIEALRVSKEFKYNGEDCYIFFDRDVTEAKEMEKKYELLEQTINMVDNGCMIFAIEEQLVTYINDAGSKFLEFNIESINSNQEIKNMCAELNHKEYSKDYFYPEILITSGKKLKLKAKYKKTKIHNESYIIITFDTLN